MGSFGSSAPCCFAAPVGEYANRCYHDLDVVFFEMRFGDSLGADCLGSLSELLRVSRQSDSSHPSALLSLAAVKVALPAAKRQSRERHDLRRDWTCVAKTSFRRSERRQSFIRLVAGWCVCSRGSRRLSLLGGVLRRCRWRFGRLSWDRVVLRLGGLSLDQCSRAIAGFRRVLCSVTDDA